MLPGRARRVSDAFVLSRPNYVLLEFSDSLPWLVGASFSRFCDGTYFSVRIVNVASVVCRGAYWDGSSLYFRTLIKIFFPFFCRWILLLYSCNFCILPCDGCRYAMRVHITLYARIFVFTYICRFCCVTTKSAVVMGISLHSALFPHRFYWIFTMSMCVCVGCCLCLNKCLSHFENMERMEVLQARNIGMPCDPLEFWNVFGKYI